MRSQARRDEVVLTPYLPPPGTSYLRWNAFSRSASANFTRVGAGMGADEVIALLGPPGRKQPLALKQQVAWEWRFLDGHETRMFVVMFDTAGRVVGTAIEDDPRRQGGG